MVTTRETREHDMKTQRLSTAAIIALALATSACGDDDGGLSGRDGSASPPRDAGPPRSREVTLRFAAKVGAADFACGQTYDGVGTAATTIEPRELRFYVQDLRLITEAGDEVPVALDVRDPWQSESVALLDLATTDGGCSGFATSETNDVITGRVPEAQYAGVAFANGVPEELNHGDPPLLPAPLQVGGMHWTWLLGYRFLKLEVGAVVTAGEVPGIGSLHTGSSACSGTPTSGFTCSRANRNDIRLMDFDPDESTVVLDVAEVFAAEDLGTQSQCHGTGAVCESTFAALGIDYETGEPLATQTAYRVE
jgi:uncharacterized repeat protein (TIGR04052 family)